MTTLLAYGQRKITKITMTMFTTEKTNHQPHGLTGDRLAAWSALVVQAGQRLAARVTAGGAANALALMVWSGVCLSSFSAEPPPQIAGAGGKVQVTPFILVVKTDQMMVGTVPATNHNKTVARQRRIRDKENAFFTSAPDQFRLPLHPFAHYDFTIDWGDGTTEIVRSGAPARQAIVDETWLAQVKKGLDQTVTFQFFDPYDRANFFGVADDGETLTFFRSEKGKTKIGRNLEYLLKKVGLNTCANVIVDPRVLENASLQRAEELVSKQAFGIMKLGEFFEQLTKLTGLTYVLHDRALFITERKDLPSLMCPQHTYEQAGTYEIKITENVIGGFPQIYFNGGYDGVKVMELAQWGGNTWASLDAAFMGCANMTISASDAAIAVTGTVKSFSQAWSGCSSVTSFPLVNTTAGTDFSEAWFDCSGLISFPLLSTAAGTNFFKAWCGCDGLTSFPLLNTAAGTHFSLAWGGCSGLTNFPLLNTSAGINFYGAWCGCYGLTNFPLLNTAAGINFYGSWGGCSGLTNFPLLNTSAGIDFQAAWCFCRGLRNFPLLNTSAGTDFGYAWGGCSHLASFPLLNTAAGTSFLCAWSGCSGLTNFPLLDTAAGTDFGRAWSFCRGLTTFPLLNTSAGTDFSYTWGDCTGLTSFPLLNTSAGTDFSYTWSDCSHLTSFPLLNTSVGANFEGAWRRCSGLKSFPLLNFGKIEKAKGCFSGVTLTSDSYGELLANIAALNKISKVEFDGGLSKAQGLIGIQAREKLTQKMGWTIYDGDHPKPKPAPKNAPPAELQPKPEAANDF